MSERFIEQAVKTVETEGIFSALELIDETIAEVDIHDVTEQVITKGLEEDVFSNDAKRSLVIKRAGQDSEPYFSTEIDTTLSDKDYDRALKRAAVIARVALKRRRKNTKRY